MTNTVYINSFLDATSLVIQQIVGVKPLPGKYKIKAVFEMERHLWIHIGLKGQLSGNIVYGIPEDVALKMVSAMMGGYVMTELNDIGHSAISELGNMISGNFSTLLSQQGIIVDITPPRYVQQEELSTLVPKQLLMLPLAIENIGTINVQVVIT